MINFEGHRNIREGARFTACAIRTLRQVLMKQRLWTASALAALVASGAAQAATKPDYSRAQGALAGSGAGAKPISPQRKAAIHQQVRRDMKKNGGEGDAKGPG